MMFFRTSLKRSIFAPKRALETKILRKGAGILLTYDLSQRGGMPLYEYLYSQIRQDIIDGILQAGERLPSKRDLARHLGVGVITVANAYDQLLMEGFIRSEERRGFFVENVSGYRRKPPKPVAPKEEPPEEPDEEFFADFKANRSGVSHFPASIWSRYMREALSLPTDNLLKTIPYNGLLELRCAIAGYLSRSRGIEVAPSQIIIGAGTEYLYGRLMQMIGSGTTIAFEEPGYQRLVSISESYGCKGRNTPIDEEGLIVSELEKTEAAAVHVSPANHFPTGIAMPIQRRLDLFKWANRTKDRLIIEDDYDSEFRFNGKARVPLFAQDANQKVIYINTFSKSLVPSLRISYMVLPPRLLKRYVETLSFYSCTVSSFEQYALARFIDEGHFERHINRMRNFYRGQRQLLLNALEESPLGKISTAIEHNAGTHFMLRVDTALSGKQIKEAGREQNLNISLISDYYLNPDEVDSRTLVINYAGIEPHHVNEVLARLGSIFPECG